MILSSKYLNMLAAGCAFWFYGLGGFIITICVGAILDSILVYKAKKVLEKKNLEAYKKWKEYFEKALDDIKKDEE